MRENRIRKVWDEGGAAVSAWCSVGSPFGAEILANQGFDSVVVDTQHGMIDIQMAIAMLQAISSKPPAPMARANWNDPAPLMKLLDAGAYGIICPMINSREECERFVGACRYPPAGYRSWGPQRGLLYGGADYFKHANATVVTLAMIETRAAMGKLDEIMSTPGLDGIYIGPSDLSIGLGYEPNLDPQWKEVTDAIAEVLKAANRNRIQPGIHCPSGKVAKERIAKGFRFCALGSDIAYLNAGAQAQLAAARGS